MSNRNLHVDYAFTTPFVGGSARGQLYAHMQAYAIIFSKLVYTNALRPRLWEN